VGFPAGPRAIGAAESRLHRGPIQLTLAPLAPVERDADKLIAEPLAGQLRTFTGLFNARYALVPVELALVPDGSGGRAALHVVIIDTRAARVMWKGDISSDGMRNFSPAIAAESPPASLTSLLLLAELNEYGCALHAHSWRWYRTRHHRRDGSHSGSGWRDVRVGSTPRGYGGGRKVR
jgi:hypothetical protein